MYENDMYVLIEGNRKMDDWDKTTKICTKKYGTVE